MQSIIYLSGKSKYDKLSQYIAFGIPDKKHIKDFLKIL